METVILYHVTPKENLESILKYGLSPNHLNGIKSKKDMWKKKLKEKGLGNISINRMTSIPEPIYRKTGFKGIWLGDEGIIEKYSKSPIFESKEYVAFKCHIPKEWLEENQVPCPALYGCETFEEWKEYIESHFTTIFEKIVEGLGTETFSDPVKQRERWERRKRMVTVKSTVLPEWLEIIDM